MKCVITAQDVLDLLPIVADRGLEIRQNSFNERGYVMDADGRCPFCALANEIDPRIDLHRAVYDAAFELKISLRGNFWGVIFAADDRPGAKLRKKLLQALELA